MALDAVLEASGHEPRRPGSSRPEPRWPLPGPAGLKRLVALLVAAAVLTAGALGAAGWPQALLLLAAAALAGVAFALAAGGALTRADRLHPAALADVPGAATPLPSPALPAVEALIDATPIPLVLLDADLAVRLFNAAALDILPNLVLGSAIVEAIRVPEVIDAVRAAAAGGGARRADYQERVPVDRSVEVHAARFAGGGGEPFMLLTLRDVSEAQRLAAMRADFVANASHELRTPLASLSGFIETLQGPARNDGAAREKFLGIMRAQAERMSRLIDDLLSLSRIELNAHVRPRDPVDLATVVGHVADTLAPLAAERGVRIELDGLGAAIEVTGDRDELIRVFENLIENAIKYGAGGGRVEVSAAPAGRGTVAVTVRVHGPGIAAEHLPRLTERFYRVDVAQSRERGGTGLGLAIVKHIVARHRGRLAVESQPGEGATFTVRLGLAEAGRQGDIP